MIIAKSLMAFIAILHFYFLILEMFLWDKPAGLKAFGHSFEKAQFTKVLAKNQGLYNGFLATGLVWAIFERTSFSLYIATFFLCCVAIAGIYGALTASKKIFFIQALPAIVTLVILYLG